MTKKLLVADDSPTIQKVVRLAFAGEDFVVEGAERGDDALEKVRAMSPDLVLADVSMPGLNGYELCSRIKSDPGLAATPVVLMTGIMEPLDEEDARRAGFNAHLTKPFGTETLIKTVNDLIGPAGNGSADPAELVSARTRQSFLGSGSILDVFGPVLPQSQRARPSLVEAPPEPRAEAAVAAAVELPPPPPDQVVHEAPQPAAHAARQVIPFPGPKNSDIQAAAVELPDEIIDAIAQRVIRQMSPDVIREVAWEVVPDLAEIIIRQYLDEHGVGKS
ncbi:MAG: putative histidine kinase [Acidobacteria bacterium]|nr:putative histidine kinase [Acidobacteriota bacterium]